MSGINFGIGDPGDAESVDGAGGVIALLKRLRTLLGGAITVTGPLDVEVNSNIGQQTMAASLPVTVASNQADVPITLDGEAVDVEVNGNIGQQTMAASLPVAIASNQSDVPVTLDSEAVDVEVNGNIGQQVKAASLPIVVASDQDALAAAAANVHEPAANTAAVVTYAMGGAGVNHVISGVAWSYDVAPTAGSLTIEDGGGTTVFVVSITAAGPGFFGFSPRLMGTANTALVITLAAAGAAVTGKVSVLGHWTV